MSRIIEAIKQKKEQENKELEALEAKLKILIKNNNLFIQNSKKEAENNNILIKNLKELEEELDYQTDILTDFLDYFLTISSDLSELRNSKKQSLKKSQKSLKNKKKRKNNKTKLKDDESLKSDIEDMKKMLGFLFSYYKKNMTKES